MIHTNISFGMKRSKTNSLNLLQMAEINLLNHQLKTIVACKC